jgi:hypothetical protein
VPFLGYEELGRIGGEVGGGDVDGEPLDALPCVVVDEGDSGERVKKTTFARDPPICDGAEINK